MNKFQNKTSRKEILPLMLLLVVVTTALFSCEKAVKYPLTPDQPGTGKVKWTELITPDGWTKVNNEGGATLGYSKSSGLQLIQVDGYAFKDLNRNMLLDQFEDWRVDFESRAKAIVEEIPVEQMMGRHFPGGNGQTKKSRTVDHHKEIVSKG